MKPPHLLLKQAYRSKRASQLYKGQRNGGAWLSLIIRRVFLKIKTHSRRKYSLGGERTEVGGRRSGCNLWQ